MALTEIITMDRHKLYYLSIVFALIILFLILAMLVSPKASLDIEKKTSLPFLLLSQADTFLFIQINQSHIKSLDTLMILLAVYGREVVWTLTGVLLLIFGGSIGRKTVLIMAMAMLILFPIVSIAKELVGRARPIIPEDTFLIAPDKKFAFPSGHATIVSAGAAVMLALYTNSNRKQIVSVGLAIEAALVCYSRIYVGGHYPLDVAGGILLGVGVAFFFVAFSDNIERRDQQLWQGH